MQHEFTSEKGLTHVALDLKRTHDARFSVGDSCFVSPSDSTDILMDVQPTGVLNMSFAKKRRLMSSGFGVAQNSQDLRYLDATHK